MITDAGPTSCAIRGVFIDAVCDTWMLLQGQAPAHQAGQTLVLVFNFKNPNNFRLQARTSRNQNKPPVWYKLHLGVTT